MCSLEQLLVGRHSLHQKDHHSGLRIIWELWGLEANFLLVQVFNRFVVQIGQLMKQLEERWLHLFHLMKCRLRRDLKQLLGELSIEVEAEHHLHQKDQILPQIVLSRLFQDPQKESLLQLPLFPQHLTRKDPRQVLLVDLVHRKDCFLMVLVTKIDYQSHPKYLPQLVLAIQVVPHCQTYGLVLKILKVEPRCCQKDYLLTALKILLLWHLSQKDQYQMTLDLMVEQAFQTILLFNQCCLGLEHQSKNLKGL